MGIIISLSGCLYDKLRLIIKKTFKFQEFYRPRSARIRPIKLENTREIQRLRRKTPRQRRQKKNSRRRPPLQTLTHKPNPPTTPLLSHLPVLNPTRLPCRPQPNQRFKKHQKPRTTSKRGLAASQKATRENRSEEHTS